LSDWKDHLSPLQWLNAILRFLGKLVPKHDNYKTNLLFEAIGAILCFVILYAIPEVAADRRYVAGMFSLVLVVGIVCVISALIITRR
jgi:hypothetical protein